jgi:hypothetical protein
LTVSQNRAPQRRMAQSSARLGGSRTYHRRRASQLAPRWALRLDREATLPIIDSAVSAKYPLRRRPDSGQNV